MRDLGEYSSLTIGDGHLVGDVSPDWDAFGPNGGYLATMALRAAATRARVRAPRTVQCQYLRPASHGEMSFDVGELGRSTRSDVIQVTAAQDDRQVLAALVRTLQPSELGATNVMAQAPEVTDPEFLRPTEDLLPPEMVHIVPMTRHFEMRPVTWERTWPPPKGRRPIYLAWFRFRPSATFDDPFVGVGRYLVLLDSYVWAAVERSTAGGAGLSARSTDLTVTIEDPGETEEWLLCEVRIPVMRGGAITATGSIWSRDGALLASGAMNMAYAPIRG